MTRDRRARPLLEADVDGDPLRQFTAWFGEAREALATPEAVAVATATNDGAPSARMVLLKAFDARGFVFYTGYRSRKARELEQNPRAALLFYWDPLGRQVRIEGTVVKTSRAESEAYFRTRPPASRRSAWASPQSEVVAGRAELEARVADVAARVADEALALPPSWGGFRLVPDRYEFWQHRDDRLHDRLCYRRSGTAWTIERLAP